MSKRGGWVGVLKLISINVAVLVAMLMVVEAGALVAHRVTHGQRLPFFYQRMTPEEQNLRAELADPCLRMIGHPFLSVVHDHNDQCEIKGGKASGGFVYYDTDEGSATDGLTILTMGGSTTDGFYQHFSDGNTYPYLLERRCIEERVGCRVINGGVGGYGSEQELIKLVSEGAVLPEDIDVVVVLDGINDIPGYNGTSAHSQTFYPYFDHILLDVFFTQRWLLRGKPKPWFFGFLPNLRSAIEYVVGPKSLPDYTEAVYPALGERPTRISDNIDMWRHDATMMKGVADAMGARFYIFVQPTMGLKGVQSEPPSDSHDESLFRTLTSDYIATINETYDGIRSYCAEMEYCVDFSQIAPPTGNAYADPRHHNASGNEVIASSIFDVIYGR